MASRTILLIPIFVFGHVCAWPMELYTADHKLYIYRMLDVPVHFQPSALRVSAEKLVNNYFRLHDVCKGVDRSNVLLMARRIYDATKNEEAEVNALFWTKVLPPYLAQDLNIYTPKIGKGPLQSHNFWFSHRGDEMLNLRRLSTIHSETPNHRIRLIGIRLGTWLAFMHRSTQKLYTDRKSHDSVNDKVSSQCAEVAGILTRLELNASVARRAAIEYESSTTPEPSCMCMGSFLPQKILIGDGMEMAPRDRTAMNGARAIVNGNYAIVKGHYATVNGDYAFVYGDHAVVNGNYARVIGDYALVNGERAVVKLINRDHTRVNGGRTTVDGGRLQVSRVHAGVMGDHAAVDEEHAAVKEEHTAVNGEHAAVDGEHAAVDEEHAAVKEEHTAVNGEHSAVDREHAAVNSDHTAVDEEHAAVEGEHTTRNGRQEDAPTNNAIHPERLKPNHKLVIVDWDKAHRGTGASDVAQFAVEAWVLDCLPQGLRNESANGVVSNRGLTEAFMRSYLLNADANDELRKQIGLYIGILIILWSAKYQWPVGNTGEARNVEIGRWIMKMAIDGDGDWVEELIRRRPSF